MKETKRRSSFFKDVLYLYKLSIKIHPPIFFATALTLIWETFTPFVLLIFPKYILDEMMTAHRWNVILQYVILMACILAFFKGLEIITKVYVNMAINLADTKTIHYFLFELSKAEFPIVESGKQKDKMFTFYRSLHPCSIIEESSAGFFKALFQIFGYIYLLTTLQPILILLILFFTLCSYMVEKLIQRQRLQWNPTKSQYERRINYLFSVLLSPKFAKETRINQVSEWVNNKFDQELRDYKRKQYTYEKKLFLISFFGHIISFFQMITSYGWAAIQTILGKISIGSFIMYAGAAYGLSEALTQLVKAIAQLQELRKYIPEYEKYKKEIAIDTTKEKESVPSKIENIVFDKVSFRYPGQEDFALKDISITIRQGEKLALVGLNGAGKSTFIKLLCRLYIPTDGKILLNGIDIQTIKREEYMKKLGVVFQDYQLFAFSILENIVLNKKKEEKQLNKALKESGFAKRIETLKEGCNTFVTKEFDEEGVDFSGGENQKLALARAIYKDAPIIILDEPSSALDPIAENELYEKLKEIASGKTAIYISHRLSSTNFCDTIAVFENGRMKEYGTHIELLKQKGLYTELYQKQAQYYIDEGVI